MVKCIKKQLWCEVLFHWVPLSFSFLNYYVSWFASIWRKILKHVINCKRDRLQSYFKVDKNTNQIFFHTRKQFSSMMYKRGSPIGFSNPAIVTQIFSQSRNSDGLYRSILIPVIQFCLSLFPNPRGVYFGGFRQVSIKETNNDVNKCIKHKRWRQSHSSITREIKKNWLNTILLLKRILFLQREPLLRWKSASRSKDGILPSSLGESYSNIPSSS